MIQALLLLASIASAQEGNPGNSCTPRFTFDSGGVCSTQNDPITVPIMYVGTTTARFAISTAGYESSEGFHLNSGSSITLSGANGFLACQSSVTASSFFGDGSHLSGITAGSEGNTYTSSKTFTTHLLVKSSVTASAFFGDGSQETGAVTQNRVNLSTVTTALDLKANLGGATFTGASGITNAAFTATGAGGHIVTGSSVVASAFFGNGSRLTGLPAGSEGNTYTSSKTFTAQVQVSSGIFANGSVKIGAGYGIGVSNNFSTMTPCGPLFFISSNTPTASTATIGTALTIFSTFTLLANTLSVGDSLIVTCLFENKVAPGTPVNGVYMGATVLGTDAFATASAMIEVNTMVTLQQVGRARFLTKAYSQVAAATTYVSVAASIGVSQVAFDATAAQTFNCKASRATGGAINFVYMRVSKSCQ